MNRVCCLIVLSLVFLSGARLLAEPSATSAATDRAAMEQKFAQTMSHARLVGYFTASDGKGEPKKDEYTLGAVTKGEGNNFIFNAEFSFGKKTIRLPLSIPVLWAGDTPVITVTDFSIPGMGTYTARVMVYGDQYIGTWSSPVHGGFMWGKLEHPAASQPAEPGK